MSNISAISAQPLLVYITTPSREQAEALAEILVRERLAAGANVIASVRSWYWWEGTVQNASESLCLCQTDRERFAALERRVITLHPYAVPCIVALPLVAGSAPFLDWISRETHSA